MNGVRHMIFAVILAIAIGSRLPTGPVLNPTGDVAVCKGSVAVLNCIYTDGTFPHFTLNNTDVSQYNVTVTESGTFLHLEVPGAPWSNNAIIRCDVSGIASEPAVLRVQGPPPLAPRYIHISCLSSDTIQMILDVPSTGAPGSQHQVVVSRNNETLLSNTTAISVSDFIMEGCYQCLPCQVLVTPMCGSDVGNSVTRMFNHLPVTPPTSGTSISGSTNGVNTPTIAGHCGVGCIAGSTIGAIILTIGAIILTIGTVILCIWVKCTIKRKRTLNLNRPEPTQVVVVGDNGSKEASQVEQQEKNTTPGSACHRDGTQTDQPGDGDGDAVQNAANTSSEQPLTAGTYVPHQDTMTSPERESRPLGEPHLQYQRDTESLPLDPLTSPNPTIPFQGTKDEEPPQPHDQQITNFTYLQPTSNGSQIPPNSVVVMVTSSGNRQAQ